MLSIFLRGNRQTILLRAGILIALIAIADWRIESNIPLGFLYLFPMLLIGSAMSRWQIAATAGFCTFLTEWFDTYRWDAAFGIPRDILIFSAFFGMGTFVYETVRNRKIEQRHLRQMQDESEARREAEEQLNVLVASSPAAILTTNSEGTVLLSNDAADRLLGLGPGSLKGRRIGDYLPSLGNVPAPDSKSPSFRTVMQCRGRREDGEVFLADVWFSTYRTSAGCRLAAMVFDTSEDLRTREEFSLHQLLTGSRILVGAISHEIRNVCGAIAVVHANLARSEMLGRNQDFEALGELVRALEKIASMELRQTAQQAARTDIHAVLDELRIVIEPSMRAEQIELRWVIDPDLPVVRADAQSLMQVFLTLAKDRARNLANTTPRELTIAARVEGSRAVIEFWSRGPEAPRPDLTFLPFQPEPDSRGLGLYLSRAFVRSFHGDLRYQSDAAGSSFIVELAVAAVASEEQIYGQSDPNLADRRPHPVSRRPEPVAAS